MTIDSVLFNLITNDTDLKASIGTRLHPNKLPEEKNRTYPCVRFKHNKGESDYAIDGPADLLMPVISLQAYSTSYLETRHILKLLRSLLDGLRGGYDDVAIQQIFIRDGEDSYEAALNAHMSEILVTIWYTNIVS